VASATGDVIRDILFSPFWFGLPSQYGAIIISGLITESIMGLFLVVLLREAHSAKMKSTDDPASL
jgi:hypothetical protein